MADFEKKMLSEKSRRHYGQAIFRDHFF